MIENMTRRYTDIGELACHSPYVGSYNHYQQDSNTFAEWGVDYVKFDGQSVCARVFYLYLCVCAGTDSSPNIYWVPPSILDITLSDKEHFI